MIESPTPAWKDYELIDCGDFCKLERFGKYVTIRPEPKALWKKSLSDDEWNRLAHTRFIPGGGFSTAGQQDSGSWKTLKRMEEQWPVTYQPLGLTLRMGMTSFKHVGVFPEQAPNWEFIYENTSRLVAGSGGKPVKVLNLFAYTGGASLAARKAGADVTHLDSVKQVVTWARQNMELSRMDSIRWVVEDALKFVRREARRGNKYQGIMLDPPAYGHGPDGEKWKLEDCLYEMLCVVEDILAPKDSFLILNLYANGYSSLLSETAVRSALNPGKGADVESGELVLTDRFGKILPLSVFTRVRL
ncbi:MAG: class I SAM-dependent methyltransferase [Bacteroidales bacterium]|nr:class I SAM-dependent methyltransferase [Bacteroidales bacterium]MBQ9529277.1 class I SAM-dependent methyltransferase [Bacteroidales bacterium]